MPSITAWDAELAKEIIARHQALPGATLPILHALQENFGHVPDDAVPLLAEALNMTRAEIHGIITFYHDFRRAPPGRHVLRLCRAEACQAMGATALHENLLAGLALGWGQTSADGKVTVEPAYCLGLCACAPAALLDEVPLGRLNHAGIAATLEQLS